MLDIREKETVPENVAVLGKVREKGLKIYTPYDDDFEGTEEKVEGTTSASTWRIFRINIIS